MAREVSTVREDWEHFVKNSIMSIHLISEVKKALGEDFETDIKPLLAFMEAAFYAGYTAAIANAATIIKKSAGDGAEIAAAFERLNHEIWSSADAHEGEYN